MNRNGEGLVGEGAHEEHEPERRSRKPSRKALQNAVETKRYEVKTLQKKLLNKIQAAEGLDDSRNVESVLRDLATTSEGLNVVVQELLSLYAQDVNHDFGDDVLLTNETLTLQRAYALMERLNNRKSDKVLEIGSGVSHCSSRKTKSAKSLSSASSASTARIKAIAEAAAARKSAEFERKIAEKELQRRKREAELERTREQERAQHEKDLAVLAANKRVAMADAKTFSTEMPRFCIHGRPHLKP